MPVQRIDRQIRLWDLVRLEASWAVRSISSNSRGAGVVWAHQVKQRCGGSLSAKRVALAATERLGASTMVPDGRQRTSAVG
jgi:hypothetical protein